MFLSVRVYLCVLCDFTRSPGLPFHRDGVVPGTESPEVDLFLQGQIVFEEFLKELVAISQAKCNLRMTAIKLNQLQSPAPAAAAVVAAGPDKAP